MIEAAGALELHEEAMKKCREVTRLLHCDRGSLTMIILSLVTTISGEKKVASTSRCGRDEDSSWVGQSGGQCYRHSRLRMMRKNTQVENRLEA